MTTREELVERRDQALRELVELEAQEHAGDLTAADAQRLRLGYEADAAAAMRALASRGRAAPAGSGGRRLAVTRGRRAAYTAALLAAGVAAGIVLPVAVKPRPPGGYVTGNEIGPPGGTPSPAARRDLATVSDQELEDVVRANPDVVGMRSALADRYFARGDYDAAMSHYARVLEKQPRNPVAAARSGWILLQAGDVDAAAGLLSRALAAEPRSAEALWFEANLRLYGRDDAAGALAVLSRLRALPDVSPGVRQQADDLAAEAVGR